jgi:hypothetical protein
MVSQLESSDGNGVDAVRCGISTTQAEALYKPIPPLLNYILKLKLNFNFIYGL